MRSLARAVLKLTLYTIDKEFSHGRYTSGLFSHPNAMVRAVDNERGLANEIRHCVAASYEPAELDVESVNNAAVILPCEQRSLKST
jgi:hypothetical protein